MKDLEINKQLEKVEQNINVVIENLIALEEKKKLLNKEIKDLEYKYNSLNSLKSDLHKLL